MCDDIFYFLLNCKNPIVCFSTLITYYIHSRATERCIDDFAFIWHGCFIMTWHINKSHNVIKDKHFLTGP